jgi:xanthine dehydrogenase YagS FAD-binding subunit
MQPFSYMRAADARVASAQLVAAGAQAIAGGTDMLQLLQEDVIAPSALIDITALPFATIEASSTEFRIGALARLAEVADHAELRRRYPVIAEALAETASPQVRNMATVGGNLLQRTRCPYFRDAAVACNKRVPGSGCPAQQGQNRTTAIFGTSDRCIAAYPGDLAVALVALDATLEILGPRGTRTLPVADLHRLPEETPQHETVLQPGEIITALHVPASALAERSAYVKVRDRASFEWALASAAVALRLDGGTVREARVAVGGVASKPWRLPGVEQSLLGKPLDEDTILKVSAQAAEGAQPRGGNAFKVKLLPATVAQALRRVGGMA